MHVYPYPQDFITASAFLGFTLAVIPLYWHIENLNVGTVMYMLWTAVGCLNVFVNSIVWKHNAINWAPVWCDISSRIIIGYSVAIPAAGLCIVRRLYHITGCRTVTISKSDKRRQVIEDLLIALGLPILDIIIYYIPQGHRFDILEDIGCQPEMNNTPVSLALVSTWPLVIGLVSACYCVATLRSFARRAASMQELEGLTIHENLNVSRYWRLMALACVEICCTVPLNAWQVALDVTRQPVFAWKGWADTHFDFSRVVLYPRVIWSLNTAGVVGLEMQRWSPIVCALVFFAFFGFAREAKLHYARVYWWAAGLVGHAKPKESFTSTYPTRPSASQRPVLPRTSDDTLALDTKFVGDSGLGFDKNKRASRTHTRESSQSSFYSAVETIRRPEPAVRHVV